jgi:hypothetical protein
MAERGLWWWWRLQYRREIRRRTHTYFVGYYIHTVVPESGVHMMG